MLYRQCCRTGQLSLVLEKCFLGATTVTPSRNYHLIQNQNPHNSDADRLRWRDSSGFDECNNSSGSIRQLSSLAPNSAHLRIRDGKLSCSNTYNYSRCRGRFMSSWLRKPCSCSILSPLVCHQQKSSFFSAVPEKKKEFMERMVIGYSAEQMFSVVSDVENYKAFLPWCESSIVKSRRKDHILADLVIGMNPVTESYTSSVFLTKPTLIRAESTKGRFFNKMLTFWRFSPGLKGKPQSCIIDFYVSLEFRSAIHANIANVFFNEVVKAMTGAFYEEAKRRYGPASCPSRKIAIVKGNDDL